MTPKKFFYVLLGLLAVLLIVFGVGYKLGLTKLSEEEDSISRVKGKIAAIDEKLALTIATQTKLEQLDFVDTIAKEVLPQEKFQPELVSQLFLIANNNNMTITSMAFSSQNIDQVEGKLVIPEVTQARALKDAPGVFTVPVTIAASGNYSSFLNFLDDLENNRRKLQVQSININPLKDADDNLTGKVGVTITLDVYVKP